MNELAKLGQTYFDADHGKTLHDIVESILGPDKKVADCTKYQSEALAEIRDALISRAEALEIAL